jgi:poly(A) polymerase
LPVSDADSAAPDLVPASRVFQRQASRSGRQPGRAARARAPQRNGWEDYCGGCVRDLLIGRRPKDFDVATSAHPRQIKRLFRNGRIIGRRFRLVHVVYGPHVVETATFRADPLPPENNAGAEEEPGDLLITEDNVYGSAAEDARRRDFTVNALFYDPTAGVILDYVDGLPDIEAGVLRTIGDPPVRFAEDPVRILRAIKFATRLGFRIEERTWQAMCESAHALTRSAAPRVAEEIFRLLRSGTALGAFRMLRASGALATLFPEIDAYLGQRDDPDPKAHDRADLYWRLLEALDADLHGGAEPSPAVLLAVLFLRVVEHNSEVAGVTAAALAADLIEPLATSARLPRRAVEGAAHHRDATPLRSPGRRARACCSCWRGLHEALHLFRLRSAAEFGLGRLRRLARASSTRAQELPVSGRRRAPPQPPRRAPPPPWVRRSGAERRRVTPPAPADRPCSRGRIPARRPAPWRRPFGRYTSSGGASRVPPHSTSSTLGPQLP